VRGHLAVAGVEPEYDPPGVGLGHLPDPGRILQGPRPEDHAGDAHLHGGFDVGLRAKSPTHLARDIHRLNDSADDLAVDRRALLGPVEVHQVEGPGPVADPPAGYGCRVIAKHGFPRVIPLLEPHALAAAQVDCRQDQHQSIPRGRGPGLWST
jgi:hypothetical protein